MEGASQVGPHLHLAAGHHVPQRGDCDLRALFLWKHGHALGDAGDGLLGYLAALAAPHQGIRVQPGAQGLALLKAQGNFLQHLPVGAPHQDAHFVQPRQIVGHGPEATDEEVADGDVDARRTAQHLLQASQQRGVRRGVQDIQRVAPIGEQVCGIILGLLSARRRSPPARSPGHKPAPR